MVGLPEESETPDEVLDDQSPDVAQGREESVWIRASLDGTVPL